MQRNLTSTMPGRRIEAAGEAAQFLTPTGTECTRFAPRS